MPTGATKPIALPTPTASFQLSDDPHYWYHASLEDPNERSYDALRRLFLNEMARVLGPEIVI
jgi:hypothetical protein